MGTLFKQDPRDWKRVPPDDVEVFLTRVKEIASKTKLSVENVLEAYRIKEMERRNDLYVMNGDIFDEQLSGIGELIQELSDNIENIKSE